MKKVVNIATVIFWVLFAILAWHLKERFGWTIFIVVICSLIIQFGSFPKPVIRSGRLYKLRAIIPLNKGGWKIVLVYDDNVETFKCEGIDSIPDLKIGNEYRVEKENGIIFFTP